MKDGILRLSQIKMKRQVNFYLTFLLTYIKTKPTVIITTIEGSGRLQKRLLTILTLALQYEPLDYVTNNLRN